ncbi:lipid A phosphoethanolamine transferase [Odoribacter lunatus]|uniref:lipid A phosphoethanolamine transferase n=1 Tax=Odoribacter lunatus TaxID=2941335 RepID=UPI0020402356|nr:lipid A phosphoethanolamine transferase [Odoribacter lunatus]
MKLFDTKFLSQPKRLFWFYVMMNLIPSICLVFTEPFTFTGKLVLLMFPLGLYLILLSLLKNTGRLQLFLFPLFILHAFQLVLFYLFGEAVIAVDMFLNVATTNVSEAGELLDNIWPAIIAVCVLYLPTTVIACITCRRKIYLPASFRKKTIVAGIVLLAVSYGLTFVARNKNTERFTLHEDVYPANVVYNLGFAINKWHNSRLYPVTSQDFKFHAGKSAFAPSREVYVLVVGEASRAENWQLYGYTRPTNPQLSQEAGLIWFEDAITQSNTTHKSVPLILSAASAEDYSVIYTHKSILSAFKEAGFTSVFLSNQIPNRSFTDFYADEADFHRNIRTADEGGLITTNTFDDAMLPLLQHYIDSIPGNLFIVLHTYGSHFNYKERYPESFSVFQPDNATSVKTENKEQLINAYDNSVLYTDDFLHRVIGVLNDAQATSALFYTSDHGEDLLDDARKRFLHASPNPTFYQLKIPVFMWFSDNYRTIFPDKVQYALNNRTKPVATNAAFHTMLDAAFIQSPYLQTDLSLVSPDFKVARRMYLNDHDKPVFFYKAGLKKEDKEMIDKRGMNH